jgi:Icc-related predicted phosphoesterase
VRIVLISDTHNQLGDITVPDGDVLVHAGDATFRGHRGEVERFGKQMRALPHHHKVFIAGNHDLSFQDEPQHARDWLGDGIVYLQDSSVRIDGVSIYGSPWQPEFCNWAFNLPRGVALANKWSLVPTGIDILVTHGPPAGIGDMTPRGEAVGCADLLAAIERTQPKIHVYGHIHEGYGVYRDVMPGLRTIFVNASTCNGAYEPVNAPIVLDV